MPSTKRRIALARKLADEARRRSGHEPALLRDLTIKVAREHLEGKSKAELLVIMTRIFNAASGPPTSARIFTMERASWRSLIGVWLMGLVWDELQEEFLANEVRPPTRPKKT